MASRKYTGTIIGVSTEMPKTLDAKGFGALDFKPVGILTKGDEKPGPVKREKKSLSAAIKQELRR